MSMTILNFGKWFDQPWSGCIFFLLYQPLSPAFLPPQSPFHRSAFQDEFHFHHLVGCLVTSIRFQMRDKGLK